MKFKKLLAILLCVGMIVCALPLTASAAKVGDTIDWVLYTDITTYINGYYIPSYNINGYTAVVVEDLLYYGFDVIWDGAAKTLKVTRNYAREFCPPESYKPSKNTHVVGSRAMPVLYTDIVTYFDGDPVTSYNVDGRTIAYVDDIASYYMKGKSFANYVYDNNTRTLKLTLEDGNTASSSPLTITRQPQDVTVATNSGKAQFSIEVKGGTAPYTYQWQVAKNGTTNYSDIPSSNTYSLNYSYSGASGTSLRCIVTDANGMVKTSSAAKILYTASTSPLSAYISGGTALASLNASVILTCTATGGTGAYTYKWYRNEVAVSSGSSTYNAQEAIAGQYRYYCVVTSGTSQVMTDTVTILFGAEPTLELTATVGKAFSETRTFEDLGVTNTFYVNAECLSDNLAEYGLGLTFTTSGITVAGTPSKAGKASTSYKLIRFDGSYDVVTLNITITSSTSSLTATATSTATTVTTDTVFTVTAKASGGVAPYTYQWYWAGPDEFYYDMSTYAKFATNTSSLTAQADPKYSTQYLKCLVRDSGTSAVFTNAIKITLSSGSTTGTSKTVTYNSSNGAKVGATFSQTILFSNFGLQSSYSMIWQKSSDLNSYGLGVTADSSKTYLTIAGTITKSGTATAVYELERADGTKDTLTIKVEIAAATAAAKNVTRSVDFTVGTKKTVTYIFSDLGLESSYASVQVTNPINSDYGISSSTSKDNVLITGTLNTAVSMTYKAKLTRSDGTVDTLTININGIAAASSGKTANVTLDSSNGAIVGNSAFSQTILFSNFGLQSSYYMIYSNTNSLSDYGISFKADSSKTYITFSGSPTKAGTVTATFQLKRTDGTIDTLNVTVVIANSPGANVTNTVEFEVGTYKTITIPYGSLGLQSSYSSVSVTKTLNYDYGVTTSSYNDRVVISGTLTTAVSQTYKAELTRANGTKDTLTINVNSKKASGNTVTVTFDSMNGAKVGKSFSQSILFSNFGGLQSSYTSITAISSTLGTYGLAHKSSDGKTNLTISGTITKAGTATATYELARSDGAKDTLIVKVIISN